MAKVLRIRAKRDGFRRAGMAHPAAPTEHALDTLTADQVSALKAEPMLVVEEVEDKPAAKAGASKSATKADD